MKPKAAKRIGSCLIILLICAILLSISWGSYSISFSEILQVMLGGGSKMQQIAIFSLRLPRIVIAMLVGSALAVSGGLLQSITRNELADAGIMGINAGASLAAVLYIFSQGNLYYEAINNFTIFTLPFIALIGSLLSALFIFLISSRHGIRPNRLLLCGIGVNIAINAIISFLTFQGSSSDYNRVLVWTSGSLWGSSWNYVLAILPMISIALLIVFYRHKAMDVLTLGDEIATGIGQHVEKERRIMLFLAVILAGAATSVAGNISFLGLLGPHIAKRLVGYQHKRFLPIAMLIAMIVIVIADAISRNLFSPLEVPVGITISLVGVPYFIYLMLKEKSS